MKKLISFSLCRNILPWSKCNFDFTLWQDYNQMRIRLTESSIGGY
jgi:hypothetical protein